MATRIINRPSIKIEVKDGKYKPFIFDNGKKRYLCDSDEPEPPTPPVPPEPTNRILYTVVEGGHKPESTWITENCSDNVFDENTGEGQLVLKKGVVEIGVSGYLNIFSDSDKEYSNLKGVTIPNSITSIGEYAFQSCTELTSVTIPNSVTGIKTGAFNLCKNLESIQISDSVEIIGSWAFSNCGGLKIVNIPNTVKGIDDGAFNNCNALRFVYSYATKPPRLGSYVFDGIVGEVLYVPLESLQEYLNDTDWNTAFNGSIKAIS